MHSIHTTFVAAPAEVVFSLASDVEAWPSLHRAYRWCRVLERRPDGLVFEMGGLIRGWPARWTAVQERDPAGRRLLFRHLRGITAGMQVEWSLQAESSGTRVTIAHDLVMRWPLVGRVISDAIVGPFFIDWIARHTLLAVARAAEGAKAK